MNQNRWHRIQEIFQSVLDLPEEERPTYLDQACGEDTALRSEIVSLVESHESSNKFLESTVGLHAFNVFVQDQTRHLIGNQVGKYKVVREIGRGGMGAVYLGQRADDQFRKQVAIKFVQPGMAPDQIGRFHRERQILAELNHPNIAALIDGGTTPTGIPYLVMDYVEGLPINEFCDKNRLALNQRLLLFRTVCSALQYAHQNLIVHLDIKPSNILVTSDGIPKLLDFGISKLLSTDPVSDGADRTVTVLRRMTPEYASPEQIRGEPLNISSDIYSLGVLLYLMLTGHLPYIFKNREAMEVARIVCEEQAERPSSAITRTIMLKDESPDPVHVLRSTSPERLRRQLSGDLDNILLMALRKEPSRRYASVDQFSEDIRRHLEALPVSARKDTIRYRTGKFISRHKAGAAAVVLVLISLIAGIIATTWQARIARQERDRARLEARKAEQINTFVQSMLSSADPEASGKDVTVAEILQEASRRVDSELKGQPEIAAEVKTTLAQTYMGLGLYEAAEPLLKSALDIRRKLYPEQSAEVALSLNRLAIAIEYKGDFATAEPMIRKSLATLRAVHGEENEDVATVLNNLGELLLLKGDLDGAEQAHRKELTIRRKLFGNENAAVAESLNDLGVVLGTKGNFAEAEKLQLEALRIIRKIRGNDHLEVAAALSSIASLLAQRNSNEAEKMFEEAIAIREKKLGTTHPQVAWSRYNYAHLLYDEGNYEDAEKLLNQILELRGKTIPENSTMIHSSLLLKGRVLSDKGEPAKAESFLREGLELRKKTLPEGHWLIASSQSSLGDCLIKLKRYKEAEELLLTASKNLEKSLGKDHQRTRDTLESLNQLHKASRGGSKTLPFK